MKVSLIILSLFCSAQLLSQLSISLKEVLEQAESQSIFSHQAKADNEVAQARWNFHQSSLRPAITLNMLAPNFIKTSREIIQPNGTIAFQSVSQNNSSISLAVQQQILPTGGTVFLQSDLQRFDDFTGKSNQYNGIPIRLGILQPLFGFNHLKWENEIQPLALTEADRKLIIDMEGIHIRAVQRYFDLLIANVNLQIANTNQEVNQQLLKIANERYELGKISKNDLLQLELELKSATKDVSSSLFQVNLSKAALMTFLGKSVVPENLQLTTPVQLDHILISEALAIEQANKNRPELVAWQRQIKESDREIKRAKVNFGVQANLSASFGYARASPQIGDIYTSPITEQQVQLSLSIPLLDWGKKKSAVGIAQAQKDLTLQQIAQSNLDFNNDIRQKVNEFIQLQTELRIQKDIQEVSIQRFEISRERYVLGDISITDLTIAQREKDQAQRNYIFTLASYWISYYEIRMMTAYDFQLNQPIQY